MSSMMKAMMQGAAGTAASASSELCVEDVFSTYLYTGESGSQYIENGIALGDFGVGTSTKFDRNEYLSRSIDFAGNTDSKTFTLSFWISYEYEYNVIYSSNAVDRSLVSVATGKDGSFYIQGRNASGANVILIQFPSGTLTSNFTHVLVSCDLSNASNRYAYINGLPKSPSYDMYLNQSIVFTNGLHAINTSFNLGSQGPCKLAHLYLDYTYRDLSVEANRRLFIDANGYSTPPSTLSALSPILYLPMTEDYAIGQNLGTGGDFTANGSPKIVQSGTGYREGYGAGGLVWTKNRNLNNGNGYHRLSNTERGVNRQLTLPGTYAEQTSGFDAVTEFKSDGYVYNNGQGGTYDYVSWTFRKAPKFFDIVTYTGDGTSSRSIPHNLGSVPGCIITKELSGESNWFVGHIGIRNNTSNNTLILNETNEAASYNFFKNNATSTHFGLEAAGSELSPNESGRSFVAYLFAHNDGDGEFGESGDQDIIKCGSYTPADGENVTVTLGYEPQWLLIKKASSSDNWYLFDNMRGLGTTGVYANYLSPNSSVAEVVNSFNFPTITSTGFIVGGNTLSGGTATNGYIYIAIRRGPMRTPTSGSEVFATNLYSGSNADKIISDAGFAVDTVLIENRNQIADNYIYDRLRGPYRLHPNRARDEYGNATYDIGSWASMNGWQFGSASNNDINDNMVYHAFRRAPSFFDVVAYTGNGVAGRTVDHKLGVKPEFLIVKNRDASAGNGKWTCYLEALGATQVVHLDAVDAAYTTSIGWNNTEPTDSQFTVSSNDYVNFNGDDYIAYLFASCPGVSKVGSYTGNGTSQNINCGFSTGARFVIIKRTDDSGDWHVWDTARGIVTGNDPFLELNTDNAENTSYDSVDPYAAGFSVNQDGGTNINVSNGTYIFLAIS